MRPMFHVTYEIVTPESAKHADAAERGFMTASGDKTELAPHVYGAAAGAIKAQHGLTLRQACELINLIEDSGHWFTEIDSRFDYTTGAEETRSFHPPDNITAASYARLRRLFNLDKRAKAYRTAVEFRF